MDEKPGQQKCQQLSPSLLQELFWPFAELCVWIQLRIWPLFLCASVVGSVHRGPPQKARCHRVFAIQVHPNQNSLRYIAGASYHLRMKPTSPWYAQEKEPSINSAHCLVNHLSSGLSLAAGRFR